MTRRKIDMRKVRSFLLNAAFFIAVVGTADNILRPVLVGRDTQMHDLLILISTLGGLVLFGVVFAINSAVHSYLILAYSDFDKVSMNVGFYYMANAAGRLTGTVLSGWVYQTQGLTGCLWWSTAFVLAAAVLSFRLPPVEPAVAPERMSPD